MQQESTNLKVLKGRETAERLLGIARKAFSEQGFAASRTEQIIARAGVTKGALYHHFSSKKDLFEAVYRSVEDEVAARISAAVAAIEDPWEQLLGGCYAYLEACQDPGLQRILRVDGPSVLGLERWSKIDREYGVDRLLPALRNMSAQGVINVPSVDAFAWQLTGAMNEATFWIARHENPQAALRESKKTLSLMLEGARVQ
ncbi:MAG: AcrR family transcriptional regulator [Woeseiaceae bacterium]|jgi:AcrR family transcriptional regulator